MMQEKPTRNHFFSFQPPAGGDVTLESIDGTVFIAHSLLLSLASSVFSDMFTSTTKADTVELTEDEEAISLMLAYIYPVERPSINTISLLEKAMLMAHKYEVDVLTKAVEQAGRQRDLVRQDPLRVYQAAGNYDFQDIEKLSAKLLTREHYDMTTTDGLVRAHERES
ncbi:hypothetical protein FRC07_001494 [Ceratobasidium sp. 392]|nr:hypothetical protein FRC07_001494 [Ceratobasidium sp. 392]